LSVLYRLGLSAAAGLGAAVLMAIIIAVIDLYLVGHGHGSITREIFTLAQAGVHLSIGDLAMMIAAIAVAVATWVRRHA
jgi:hypothetical protein